MFLFQTRMAATDTQNSGKTLTAQEFSKKLDQLYVRTKVSYDMLQDQYGGSATKFKNFLNTSTSEKAEALMPLRERKLGEKATALLGAEAEYHADFKGFEKKYNALKDALRSNDPQKIESAMAGISRNYFELLGSQAKFAQRLNEYDTKGIGYAKSVLELTLDMAMAAGIITGAGGMVSLTRRGLAIAIEEFIAKGARESAKRAYEGAMFFTALGVGTEYYSFNKLSKAMARVDKDAAGALGELSSLLHETAKRAGSDGESLAEIASAVDGARAELVRGLKADPSFRLEPGRITGYFGESFVQFFIMDAGFGFFKAAGKASAPSQLSKESTPVKKPLNAKTSAKFLSKNDPDDGGPALQSTIFPFFKMGGKGKGFEFPVKITHQSAAQCVANSFYYALTYLGFRGEKEAFIGKFQNETGTVQSGPRGYEEVRQYLKKTPELSGRYAARLPIKMDGCSFKTAGEATSTAMQILDDLKKEEGRTAMMVIDESPQAWSIYGMPHSTMIYAARDATGALKLYEVNTFGSKMHPFNSKPVKISESTLLFKMIRAPGQSPEGGTRYTITPFSVLFISRRPPEVVEPPASPGIKITPIGPEKKIIKI